VYVHFARTRVKENTIFGRVYKETHTLPRKKEKEKNNSQKSQEYLYK
jgi:hypothetical protein